MHQTACCSWHASWKMGHLAVSKLKVILELVLYIRGSPGFHRAGTSLWWLLMAEGSTWVEVPLGSIMLLCWLGAAATLCSLCQFCMFAAAHVMWPPMLHVPGCP